MPTLIACLSTGKGTWTEVVKIIKARQWDRIFLLTNQFGRESFIPTANTKLIVVDDYLSIPALVAEIKRHLKDKVTDFEVAINIVSGSGREHMALLEAVLELGLNFRVVTIQNNQLKIMGLEPTS